MTLDLTAFGWDAGLVAAYGRHARPDQRPARVTRVDRGLCTVLGADGACRVGLGSGMLAAAAADRSHLPCAGDWVVVRRWPDDRMTLEAVLPRRTALITPGSAGQPSAGIVASNVDSVGVVVAMEPRPDLARIERLLALAFESGATPVVILSKADLAVDPDALVAQVSAVAADVTICPVSAVRGTGLDALRAYTAHGRTLALVGPSGSGKSSLVNALAGATVIDTQTLVPLPTGGCVMTTPAVEPARSGLAERTWGATPISFRAGRLGLAVIPLVDDGGRTAGRALVDGGGTVRAARRPGGPSWGVWGVG